MRKRIMDWALYCILIYTALCAFLFIYQRNLMYFPGGLREPIEQLTTDIPQTLKIATTNEITFDLWYWPAKPGFETIVFFHGNGQAYQYWVNKMMNYREQGYGIFFTDYRGYGGFGGKPTEKNIYHDARIFLKHLHETQNIPFNDMIFYGESLGTGVATQMATEFTPKAIILESAYNATSEVAKSRYWMFPVDLLMQDQYCSIDKIAALTMPKLFIHGEQDSIIPIRFSKALFERAPEPKTFKVIDNAGHNNLYDHGAPLHIASFLSTITTKESK